MNGKIKYILAAGMLVMGICIAVIVSGVINGNEEIEFETVKNNDIPRDISLNVIPEYRDMERALACVVDGVVYVVVTRGEKPTSGFEVSVEKIILEEKNRKSNLVVCASFKDPQKKSAVSQILTYPVSVVKTNLNSLPDTIELRIEYNSK